MTDYEPRIAEILKQHANEPGHAAAAIGLLLRDALRAAVTPLERQFTEASAEIPDADWTDSLARSVRHVVGDRRELKRELAEVQQCFPGSLMRVADSVRAAVKDRDRFAAELGAVADALPDWKPGAETHAEAVARVVKERDALGRDARDEEAMRDHAARERDAWADAIRSVAAGGIPTPDAARVAIAELKDAWDKSKARVNELLGELALVRRERKAAESMAGNGAWIWSDTDPNYLDSLVEDAVILMRAAQLRKLIAERAALAANRREYLYQFAGKIEALTREMRARADDGESR